MAPGNRNRDFFAAIVVGGLAFTGCSSDDETPVDVGADVVADAGSDRGVEDVGTDDAEEDTFVAIL